MIYIFNSVYRPLYRNNVLVTLFLPNQYINQYRYRYASHVDPNLIDAIKKNESVLIVFIDRFRSDKYFFYPLRSGNLTNCRQEADQLFLEVQMGNFLFSNNLEKFNEELKNGLTQLNLPHKTSEDPEMDGYYAIHSDFDIQTDKGLFIHGDEAWVKTVDLISATGGFKNKNIVFVKAELRAISSDDKIIKPLLKNKYAVYRLFRNKIYDLQLLYRFPVQKSDPSRKAKLTITSDNPLYALSNPEFSIAVFADILRFRFASKNHPEEKKGNISFNFKPDNPASDPEVIGPETNFFVEIKEKKVFWFSIIVALLFWSIGGVLATIDFTKMEALCIRQLLSNEGFLFKIYGNVLQAAGMGWLFFLIGKKFL